MTTNKSKFCGLSNADSIEHFQWDTDINLPNDWLDTLSPFKKEEVIDKKVEEKKTSNPYHIDPRAPKRTLDPFEVLYGNPIPYIGPLRYTPRMTSFPREKEIKAPSFETSNLVSIQTRHTDQSSYVIAEPISRIFNAPAPEIPISELFSGNVIVKQEEFCPFYPYPFPSYPVAQTWAPPVNNSHGPQYFSPPMHPYTTMTSQLIPPWSVSTPHPQIYQTLPLFGKRQVPHILMKKVKLENRRTTPESPEPSPSKKPLMDFSQTMTSQHNPSRLTRRAPVHRTPRRKVPKIEPPGIKQEEPDDYMTSQFNQYLLEQKPDVKHLEDKKFTPEFLNDPLNAPIPEGFILDTKKICQDVAWEIKQNSISQAIFGEKILCRSQGTLSDILRNPRPWNEIRSGRKPFIRMYNWLKMPFDQRMNIFRVKREVESMVAKEKKERRERVKFLKYQKERLEKLFKEDPRPSSQTMKEISLELSLEFNTVQNFFTNARRRKLVKKEEEDPESIF